MLRKIEITADCLSFIDAQDSRFGKKVFQIIEVVVELKTVHAHFVKKLVGTTYYELRIKAEKEYRLIMYPVDSDDFNQCSKAICLVGFIKKSTSDYKKALKRADTILKQLDNENF